MWVRQRQGVQDHLWAIRIITAPRTDKKYEWIDLGKRPDGFFDVRVEIGDFWMGLYMDDTLRHTFDISYWNSVKNYFKAGVYINRHEDYGKAAVEFQNLLMQ